ncbi:MAG: hypothetical protein O3C43_06825 [Verrucomicrobia bacterium]|nr:hypothetical protein [Verrucomicrobiota bacterium]MDA1066201.1 hypothetical protein [Verrucomicrobiota bacterium]
MAKNTPVVDIDQEFTRKRTNARRLDAKATVSERLTPADLQRRNSILPEDFWDKSEIDWEALAVGKKPHS